MALKPSAALELINRMQQVGAALAQAGVLKTQSDPDQYRCADDNELQLATPA